MTSRNVATLILGLLAFTPSVRPQGSQRLCSQLTDTYTVGTYHCLVPLSQFTQMVRWRRALTYSTSPSEFGMTTTDYSTIDNSGQGICSLDR